MLRQLLLFILFITILFTSLDTYAQPEKLNQIVIFGDSLSDDGNLFNGKTGWWVPVPAHFMPKPPYLDGRFSNGLIWTDFLAANNQKIKVLNYAVGGSTINNYFGWYLPYTLGNQIDSYFSTENPTQDMLQKSLFIIWMGANDYLRGIQYFSSPEADTDYAIDTLKNNIAELIYAQVNHILIVNLPDLAKTPYGRLANSQELHQLTKLHNLKIGEMIKKLKIEHKELKLALFDAHNLFEALIADAQKFNKMHQTDLHITESTTSCWLGGYWQLHEQDAINTTKREAKIARDLRLFLHSQHPENPSYDSIDTKASASYINASPSLYQAYTVSYDAGKVCKNPEEYIFWDKVHPTTVVHQAIAKIISETIFSEFLVQNDK